MRLNLHSQYETLLSFLCYAVPMNREHMERASSRDTLDQSTAIGRYNCLALYERSEIKIADSPKCPRCNAATLIGDAGVNELSRTLLVSLRRTYVK